MSEDKKEMTFEIMNEIIKKQDCACFCSGTEEQQKEIMEEIIKYDLTKNDFPRMMFKKSKDVLTTQKEEMFTLVDEKCVGDLTWLNELLKNIITISTSALLSSTSGLLNSTDSLNIAHKRINDLNNKLELCFKAVYEIEEFLNE